MSSSTRKPETLEQFFRSVTPNTGPYDARVIAGAMSALFTRIGPGILFTHPQAGGPGWLTAIRNQNVKACCVRAGQRLRIPRRRASRCDAKCGRHLVTGGGTAGRF